MSEDLTWWSERKAFREGRVNSPSRAMVKKVVVKQAKTDTSSGTEISILDAKETIIVMVQGACLGLLDERGAYRAALSRAAFISTTFMIQGALWRVCHACTA